MIDWIMRKIKDHLEQIEKDKDIYRVETLERRFKNLPSNQAFTFLHLYDPMEYPIIVTSEHVARFIDQKKELNQVEFEYYLKCPSCRHPTGIITEGVRDEQDCRKCSSKMKHNKENTYISFKKI